MPTIFDAVKAAGLKSAAFFWPETKDDPAIADNVAEVFRGRPAAPTPRQSTPGLLDEFRAAGIPIDAYYAFYDDPFAQGAGDIALTKAAVHVLTRRMPALTAIHLLVTDKVQHEFGPAHYLSGGPHDRGLLRRSAAPGRRRRRAGRRDDVRDRGRSRLRHGLRRDQRRAADR